MHLLNGNAVVVAAAIVALIHNAAAAANLLVQGLEMLQEDAIERHARTPGNPTESRCSLFPIPTLDPHVTIQAPAGAPGISRDPILGGDYMVGVRVV